MDLYVNICIDIDCSYSIWVVSDGNWSDILFMIQQLNQRLLLYWTKKGILGESFGGIFIHYMNVKNRFKNFALHMLVGRILDSGNWEIEAENGKAIK